MEKLYAILALMLVSTAALANVSIINGLTHIYSGVSGEEVKGEVVLLNTTDRNQRVTFEINEAIFSCTANRIFTEQNPHAQSSSSWLEGEVMDKVMAPREKYIYRFTIHIPNDLSLQGSYWSVLMVSVDNPIKEELLTNNIGLNTKIRYAVGLLTHVNSFDEVNLDFEKVDLTLDTLSYEKALDIKVRNDGTFIEGVELTLEVYDASGKKVDEFTTDRNMVFPGVCKNYLLDVSVLPDGEYQCMLLAGSRDEYTGANFTLSLK